MKPKNFPGHKNQRRLRALDRLRKSLVTRRKYPSRKDVDRIEREISVLERRVADPTEARKVRTKKSRSNTRHNG